MKHESTKEGDLSMESTEKGFNFWLNQEFISDSLRQDLAKAEILLVPQIGFRDRNDPVFPVKTEELLGYLKRRSKTPDKIDICIDDDEYKELALHSALLVLASIVVTSVALPTLVNILSEYIKNKIFAEKKDRNIKVTLYVQDHKGLIKQITYEGNPENFADSMNSIKKITNSEK